ncbi:hypothetical protein BJX76DRAFT_266769 [Aspergillus varians]
MPQSIPQPESEPFLIAFFPWICLIISFIFVLIRHGKYVVGLCRDLRLYLPCRPKIKAMGYDFGPDQGTRGMYTRVDGEGEDEDENEDEGVLYLTRYPRDNLTAPKSSTKTNEYDCAVLNDYENEDSKAGNNNHNDNLSPSTSFSPITALLYEDVLESLSPSPSPCASLLTPENDWRNEEEDINLRNNGTDTSIDNTTTDLDAATDTPAGWVHNLVEAAVRRFERLHTSESNYQIRLA